jgi:hypothetical protein
LHLLSDPLVARPIFPQFFARQPLYFTAFHPKKQSAAEHIFSCPAADVRKEDEAVSMKF